MNKQLLAIAAIAVGAISIASAASTAQAATINTGIQNTIFADGAEARIVKTGGRRHFKFHRHFKYGYGYTPYYYTPKYYGYDCHYWLKKAKWTGSHYFWRKYKRCINRGWY